MLARRIDAKHRALNDRRNLLCTHFKVSVGPSVNAVQAHTGLLLDFRFSCRPRFGQHDARIRAQANALPPADEEDVGGIAGFDSPVIDGHFRRSGAAVNQHSAGQLLNPPIRLCIGVSGKYGEGHRQQNEYRTHTHLSIWIDLIERYVLILRNISQQF